MYYSDTLLSLVLFKMIRKPIKSEQVHQIINYILIGFLLIFREMEERMERERIEREKEEENRRLQEEEK